MAETQTMKILDWLLKGKTLTPLQALRKFGSLRLGARIYELRKNNWPIVTKLVTKNGKTFAEYKIIK